MSRKLAIPLIALVAIAAPLVLTGEFHRQLLVLSLIFAILAASWDLTLGYAGIFNFAHITFFAIGGYTVAIMGEHLGTPSAVGALVAIPIAMVAGALAFIPILRLSGIYVALATFALNQLGLLVTLGLSDLTGGSNGIVGINEISLFGFNFDTMMRSYYGALVVAAVSIIALRRIAGSSLGVSLIALRDFEEYATSLGVSRARQQFLSIVFSAGFAGLAGALYVSFLGVATQQLYSFSIAVTLLAMLILGGTSTIYGSVLGAFLLTFGEQLYLEPGPWQKIIVAAGIIITMLLLPKGLWPVLSRIVPSRPLQRASH